MFKILEISEKQKGGRVPIRIALLEIHQQLEQTNDNGLHWSEENVDKNKDSAKSMGIYAEFADKEKRTPIGHGLSGFFIDKDGTREPKFENSEGVGVVESVSIQDVEINNKFVRALVGDGFLYGQRYPNFVQWVRENKANGHVDTSIEIMGLKSNNKQIVYAEENPTENYRTPVEFDFSGVAILSVEPADKNAIVLEVAEKKKKEETEMDEKTLKELIVDTITECNNKSEEFTTQIAELNSQLDAKDTTIAELNESVEQSKAEIDQLKESEEKATSEINALKEELNKLQTEKKVAELNEALSAYTEEEQKFAESEINAFNENPLEGDISVINAKICMGIVTKQKEAEKISELNSKKEQIIDIFSEISEAKGTSEDESVNIF